MKTDIQTLNVNQFRVGIVDIRYDELDLYCDVVGGGAQARWVLLGAALTAAVVGVYQAVFNSALTAAQQDVPLAEAVAAMSVKALNAYGSLRAVKKARDACANSTIYWWEFNGVMGDIANGVDGDVIAGQINSKYYQNTAHQWRNKTDWGV